jgi:hypothetical protein
MDSRLNEVPRTLLKSEGYGTGEGKHAGANRKLTKARKLIRISESR